MDKRLVTMLCVVFASMAVTSAQGYAACAKSSHAWIPTPAATTRPQVLVVGVYHMANPNHDVADVQAGDVLGPKRQVQIKHVVAVLKRFKPTKVAVERVPGDPHLAAYAQYLTGKHALTRNEVQQIGFRLAKDLGLKNVCGVDADLGLNFNRVTQYAKSAGRLHEYKALLAKLKRRAKAQTAYLHAHTVLQTLIRLNSDTFVAKSMAFYYRIAHFSRPGHWGAADLVSAWFKRNMRIYANIVNLIDSPHARILVIIGAGHLGWLRHDFASDPTIRLRKLAEFVK